MAIKLPKLKSKLNALDDLVEDIFGKGSDADNFIHSLMNKIDSKLAAVSQPPQVIAAAAQSNDKDKDKGDGKPPPEEPPHNNAAKDDAFGQDGDFVFTVKDLLANDPGGANKNGTLFFGNTADQNRQAEYLAEHVIVKISDENGGTYQINAGATDIDYMVEIGNNGTWSQAHVDITAPAVVPPVECVIADIAHNGSFEGLQSTTPPNGQDWNSTAIANWYNSGASNDKIEVWDQTTLNNRGNNGLIAKDGHVIETDGYGSYTLEPGTNASVQDVIGTKVDAVEGKSYTISFDYAARGDVGVMNDATTDSFDVYWNGEKVGSFDPNASDHYWTNASITVTGAAGKDTLEFREAGSNDSVGALIDNVKVVGCNAEDTPPAVYHNGGLMAEWTFENHNQAGGDNTGTPTGFWNLDQWAASHLGLYGDDADNFGFTSDIQVHGVDGHRGLDTAGSPGNIFLQAIPEGRGGQLGRGATMPDLEAGKTYNADVMILKQSFAGNAELEAAGHEGTDPDAWVSFQFNGKALDVKASDITVDNKFVHFNMQFEGIAGEDSFVIQSHGTHDDAQGLIIDQIQIHEWVI